MAMAQVGAPTFVSDVAGRRTARLAMRAGGEAGYRGERGWRPGAKKAETGEITPVTGWNTAAVAAPVSLPAGTYWLAYLPSSSSLRFRRAGSGTCRYYSYTYGVMPATFGTSTTSISDRWSFYGTLQP